ncbi:MAG TPA: cytidylate kinase-like family protein [Candidatus Limnocylindria bacterium]|nr:cytidylate kinase-like family protein [Candidatus Limnocylindria bacterium]
MPVITISRQFGAAGAPVGRALAERFGAEFLDRAIVAQAALRAGIPEADLESYDERLPTMWQRVTSALSASPDPAMPSMTYVEQLPPLSVHERLVEVTRHVVEEAAATGNAVIVGRGGVFILGKQPGTLHVELHASLDARVRYLLARVEDIPAEARPEEKALRELCQSIDAARAEYIRSIFDADWLDLAHYDLAIDTGRLGVAKSVDLIEAAARAADVPAN